MEAKQFDTIERYEIHCAKRYLDYTENEHFRVFRDGNNPECWMANYAVLKSTLHVGDTFYRVERFFLGARPDIPVSKFLSRPDSVSLEQARASLERYGYTVKQTNEIRMVQQAPMRPGLEVLPLAVSMRIAVTDPQERALILAGAKGKQFALLMADTQIAAGAKAFFAHNHLGVPVSWCLGEGYGSAFYLSDLFTPQPCRGQGCATAVVCGAVRYARELGYTTIFLDAEAGEKGAAARQIYEAIGFRGTPHTGYLAFKGTLPEEM